jgi:hypothetical protein
MKVEQIKMCMQSEYFIPEAGVYRMGAYQPL